MVLEDEHELKILGVNRDILEARVIGLGSRKIFDGQVDSHFFDYPIGKTLESDGRILRVRTLVGLEWVRDGEALVSRESITTELATKKRRQVGGTDPKKTYEEKWVYGANYVEPLRDAYLLLGMVRKDIETKARTSYEVESPYVRYEFDTVLGSTRFLSWNSVKVPTYLEVEARDDEIDREAVRNLGFDPDKFPVVNWSTEKVIKYYVREAGFDPNKIFDV